MGLMKNHSFFKIIFLLLLAFFIRFFLSRFLESENHLLIYSDIFLLFVIGVYLIQQTASIIGKTTGVLKNRTGLAGGLLQSIGTAFPDMVIGVVSAVLSLEAAATDPLRAINLAIIAASTTFGSNIYNVFHAAWCIYRQNLADRLNKTVLMFPFLPAGGQLKPMSCHQVKPPGKEIDASLVILVMLSLLTTAVALSMVLFGKIKGVPIGYDGDLYQLNRPIGFFILFLGILTMYFFRRGEKGEKEDNNEYQKLPTIGIFLDLLLAGVVILFSAQGIVEAISKFSQITGVPYVVSGILTALVGCLGEMIVVHNFSVNPNGRIGDAIIGVAMDNIVTTIGAAFIAILGGIFLGSDALIVIFVLILFGNTLLMAQIGKLKDTLYY